MVKHVGLRLQACAAQACGRQHCRPCNCEIKLRAHIRLHREVVGLGEHTQLM